MPLEGRNILITGAAGGLGSTLALKCARDGARVLLVDNNRGGLESLCDSIDRVGRVAPGYCELDLSEATPAAIDDLIAGIRSSYGEIDGLVHCAVLFEGLQPMDQIPGDRWLRQMQVNVNVPWLLTSCCLESLKSAPAGRIVFLLDDAVAQGLAYWGAYGVSKAGLRHSPGVLRMNWSIRHAESTVLIPVQCVPRCGRGRGWRKTRQHSRTPDTQLI